MSQDYDEYEPLSLFLFNNNNVQKKNEKLIKSCLKDINNEPRVSVYVCVCST